MSLIRCRWVAALPVWSVLLAMPAVLQGQDDPSGLGRRVAMIATIAVDEYALGVTGGRVVLQDEFNEAVLFLDEARDLAAALPEPARVRAEPLLEALIAGVRALEPAEALGTRVDELRRAIAEALGIVLDPLPQEAPSLAAGARLYAANCVKCHGDVGAGDGPRASELYPAPADLTDRAGLHGSSPLDFFRKITVGVAGTDMASFEDGLSVRQRWALALYTSGLRYGDAARARGSAWVAANCPTCDVLLSGFSETAAMSDDSLSALIGASSRSPPPASPDAVAFARTASAKEALGSNRRLAALRVARQVDDGVAHAVRLAHAGDREAALSRALAAYLVFERVESAIGAKSPGAVRKVETAFVNLRTAIARGELDGVIRAHSAVREALEVAVGVVAESSSPAVLFGQSLIIILREGIEAIVIIGALIAFLAKAGARERTHEVGLGAGAAIVASLATAVLFATVVSVTAAEREALEGLTMLLASVVLFSVASWMVSKIEADKWKAFVGSKIRQALTSRGKYALAGVAFLAVYREGVETVLFYGALFGTADGAAGSAGVLAGLLVGSAALVLLYVAILRYGVRIPLKPFFAVTGMLLTVMAVSFAGQGVAELQAAGWIPATPFGHLPPVPALGVFPTVQTLAAQFLLAAAFLAALVWIFFSPRPAASALSRDGR